MYHPQNPKKNWKLLNFPKKTCQPKCDVEYILKLKTFRTLFKLNVIGSASSRQSGSMTWLRRTSRQASNRWSSTSLRWTFNSTNNHFLEVSNETVSQFLRCSKFWILPRDISTSSASQLMLLTSALRWFSTNYFQETSCNLLFFSKCKKSRDVIQQQPHLVIGTNKLTLKL